MTAKWRHNGPIKQVSGNKLPTNLFFFDVETFIEKSGERTIKFPFRLGCAIYVRIDKLCRIRERITYTYNSIDEFIDILMSHVRKTKTLHIFNHNVGFDIRVLNLPFKLLRLDFDSEPPIINDRLFIWKLKSAKGNIIFIDTANFAVQSVKKLGKDMKKDKGEVNFETDDSALIAEYCMNDVEIIETFILSYLSFLHKNDLGKFQVSLASQALYSWRYRLMQQPIHIHDNEEILAMEREGYHGGRVECFYLGKLPKDNYYYLDINSMYPYIMKSALLPYKLNSYATDIKPYILDYLLRDKYCIALVELDTDEPVYPIMRDNRLVFPIGKFSTVLHSQELQYAVDHQHIRSVKQCAVYEQSIMFSDYVNLFYNVKQQAELRGDSSWRFISKIFLNSLYGKFGQMNVERIIIGKASYNTIWRLTSGNPKTGQRYQEIAWYGNIYRELKSGEATYSFPAIAGAITASSRMLLWSIVKQANIKNTFYVDTDSVIVNYEGYNNLKSMLDEHTLGMLKVEDMSDILELRGAKDYTFGSKSKTKGKSEKATNLTDNRWTQLQFQSFLAWLNTGATDNPIATNTTKERSGKYQKGNKNETTGRVEPFKLNQL